MLAALLLLSLATAQQQQQLDFDVLVYGATPAGVLAADAAAGEDSRLRVALLDPRALVGGCMAGGLANSDTGTVKAVIGGRARKFFEQVNATYGGAFMWAFEPKVAEAIFRGYFLASKGNVALYSSTRIVSVSTAPSPSGRRLTSVTVANGTVYSAKVFVDASYEGFLLPLAKVSSTFGREPASQYNESAAGVTDTVARPGVYTVQPQLFAGANPRWANGTLLPLVQAQPPGAIGSGDNRTQAYMFRLTTTGVPGKFLQPWPLPARYDPAQYELFRRVLAAAEARAEGGAAFLLHDIISNCTNLPHGKCDQNSQFFDQTGPGFSWDYPAALLAGDWDAQVGVWGRYRDFQLGLIFFLQNDPGVPAGVRARMGTFGLPLDEYPTSSGTPVAGFPPQLYVREALRMVSDFVLTAADRETALHKNDSIGMGSYSIDVIPVSRFARGDATVMEGGIQAPSFLPPTLPPFQIPYRAIIPRQSEATNLLVPGALSASHLAFCAVRLEPTWMVLGESAGVAAARAVAAEVDVQALDVPALQARLRQLGQVLEYSGQVPGERRK
jgi:hypothetical protein